jgi:hypothetical protein
MPLLPFALRLVKRRFGRLAAQLEIAGGRLDHALTVIRAALENRPPLEIGDLGCSAPGQTDIFRKRGKSCGTDREIYHRISERLGSGQVLIWLQPGHR